MTDPLHQHRIEGIIVKRMAPAGAARRLGALQTGERKVGRQGRSVHVGVPLSCQYQRVLGSVVHQEVAPAGAAGRLGACGKEIILDSTVWCVETSAGKSCVAQSNNLSWCSRACQSLQQMVRKKHKPCRHAHCMSNMFVHGGTPPAGTGRLQTFS